LPPVGTVSVSSGLLCSNRVTQTRALGGVLGGCDSMSWIVVGVHKCTDHNHFIVFNPCVVASLALYQ